jgi:hypothetical protein
MLLSLTAGEDVDGDRRDAVTIEEHARCPLGIAAMAALTR